ncbi:MULTISPECIES: hypothetical protein [unclassified Bradyrhizobium]|uniref:hypothetical protein n=1 Tax=unclassified Bradyrhizobium TaxID=2631580 RepID=UPI0015C69DC3|nr:MULTISPECIES: hypothetical protein [unclassified Bradyrhizobium]MBB4256031.1 hypothetical protein [Bradyrhizobium sp. CIR3A]MBB4392464.1 hypothetical protein [Bradyrhizobium sp. ERR14]NYG48199.1 hypothetical protein [Bradyrhizobium sp. IAR9]
MNTSDECRALAANYRLRAAGDAVSLRRAAVLRNIAKSLAALASQYEILESIIAEEKP